MVRSKKAIGARGFIPWRTIGLVLLVCIPIGLGFWSGWRSASTDSLEIDERYLDIGTVQTGRPVEHRVVVHNAGRRTVTIPKISASFSCGDVVPHSFRVPPGESVELAVMFDPSRLVGAAREEAEEFQVQLAFFEQGRRLPQQWILSGRVIKSVTMSPDLLAFYGPHGAVRGRSGPTLRCEATVNRASYRVTIAGRPKTCRVDCRREAEGGTVWTVLVTPKADIEGSRFEEMIWLRITDQAGSVKGEWPLKVKGVVEEAIACVPQSVDLYPEGGTVLTETVILHSNDGRSFRMGEQRRKGIEIVPRSDEWSTDHIVVLKIDPSQVAEISRPQIDVEYRDGAKSSVSVRVAVHRVAEGASE